MARLARKAASNPAFLAVARNLGTMSAVDSFIRQNYAYRDESEEIVRSPEFMLADMGRIDDHGRAVGLEGDCDDISTLYAAFADSLGYRARFVAIRYNASNPNFEHVYAQYYDGGQWITLDGTVVPGRQLHSIEEMVEEL
jgi:transglutaminase-like putative cysteine protease